MNQFEILDVTIKPRKSTTCIISEPGQRFGIKVVVRNATLRGSKTNILSLGFDKEALDLYVM